MPFTGSHAAAVLPFVRWGLPASALVIGSMSPDLPYYAPIPVSADLSHSIVGIVGVDLAMGLAAFLLWQALVGPAIVAWSPSALRARLADRLPAGVAHHLGRPRQVTLSLLGLPLGSVTHVLWDAFTHKGRWGEHHIAWLAQSHGPLPGYRWAQYGSGVIGLSVLVAWSVRWWLISPARETDGQPGLTLGTRISVTILIALSTVAGAAYGFVIGLADPSDPARRALFMSATTGGEAGATALLAAAVVWRLSRLPRNRLTSEVPEPR